MCEVPTRAFFATADPNDRRHFKMAVRRAVLRYFTHFGILSGNPSVIPLQTSTCSILTHGYRTRSADFLYYYRCLLAGVKHRSSSTCTAKNGHLQEPSSKDSPNFARLRYLCENRDLDAARELLDGILSDDTLYVTSAFNCLLHHAVEFQDHKTVEYVLGKMSLHSIKKDGATYYMLAQYFTAHGLLWQGLQSLREMQAEGLQTHARNYHPLILSAVQQQSLQVAFKLCNEMRDIERRPSYRCYTALIDGVTRNNGSMAWRNEVYRLLERFRTDREKLDPEMLSALQNWFSSQSDEKWKAEWSQISDSGLCQSCNEPLETGQLSGNEYLALKTHLLHQLWHVISQLPHQTMKCFTPLGNFTDNLTHQSVDSVPKSLDTFIGQTGPYDVVVDALNVGYQFGKNNFLAQMVHEICSLFLEEGKRVLVIGAAPIRFNAPKSKGDISRLVKFLSKHCGLFLLRDTSAVKKRRKSGIPDDMYMLLAAMHCGIDTLLVSNDMFHDHMHSLPVEIRSLFSRWLRCRQVIVSATKGVKPTYKRHPAYDHVIQRAADSWHFPSNADDSWLCVHKS
ncbi:mitochondrial ribonuclease P catalytic subunit isoform X2 [Nematostella vectensis]|uniref:mitochondrial ribonuclease P catalytic subunit isoform X2 n=1 Tax=Nematostella vectensis TaxID=45351 RepID=UPI002076D93C|nr:mitochondrial ribonuclease P catalytic subunit isoform X2 [Nematostella vectensis]